MALLQKYFFHKLSRWSLSGLLSVKGVGKEPLYIILYGTKNIYLFCNDHLKIIVDKIMTMGKGGQDKTHQDLDCQDFLKIAWLHFVFW